MTAVAHAVGSTPAYDVRASTIAIKVASHGAPRAVADALTTKMSTAHAIDLIANDDDPEGDRLTVTGFTQGEHGRVTVVGTVALYTPTPGFVGRDCFRYTISDGQGHSATANVSVTVEAVTPQCSITIVGPATAVIGPPIHFTATATCNIGTPEIEWRHRLPGHSSTVFQRFSTATTADYVTTNATAGTHQFFARVRSQGTTTTFASNTLNITLSNEVSPCTAVVLDAPTSGAVFRNGQAIALHATATCPAGTTPEYAFRARVPGAADWTTLGGFGGPSSSFTPPHGGDWELSAIARRVGSQVAFEVESAAVAVSVGDAPTANDDALTVDEDTSGTVNVLANDVDPNGDPLTATIVAGPDAGTATIANGIVSYTPAADYHGTDSVTYSIDDGHGNTATAIVHITINSVNDAPVAVDDDVTANEDTGASVDVVLNDVDVDGDALAITAITAPAHGTATFDGSVVTYVPAHDYNGADAFQYTISDGHGGTSTATVSVSVVAVNDTPIAVDDELTTPEDADGGVYLIGNDIDPDGDTLVVVAFDQPAHGTVSVSEGFATYHPNHDYNGDDSFTYTVQDSGGLSSTASVHITVLPVNDAPVGANDTAALDEDTSATIDVVANDSDVDGDTLAITAVTQPAHGTAQIVSGHEVSYTPAPDFNGDDSFTYTIADPTGAQTTATVALAVAAVNDAPVAVEDAASLDEDTSATIDVVANDSDVDGDALAITAITQPVHGTAAIVDAGHVAYTPEANYHGPDAFSYTIDDGHGGEATAPVTVTVISVNDAPVAVDDAAIVDEDTPVTIDVAANDSDVDGDALTVTGVTQPAHGTAVIVDAGHVAYTPAANYNGPDGFSYTIDDGHGGSATAAVLITVIAVNDAPVAVGDAASLLEDGSVVIDVVANDSDVDGDPLAIAAVTQGVSGTVAIVDAHHVLYTPAPNFHGNDLFGYTVTDPAGGMASALVAVEVISVNDAPLANNDAASLDEDTAVTVDVVANDFDVDGDALAITAITQPAHGLATLVDGHRVLYVPAPNYHGPDSVGYTIGDGNGAQASAVLFLEVLSVNDAPVAVDDAANLDEDTAVTVDVVANDSDVDGDALAIASIAQPAHGVATISDAHSVRYTPAANFHGTDAVTYTVDDGHGGQATATLALNVIGINDTPVAVDDAANLDEDTTASVDVVANDSDVDGDALHVVAVTPPANGTAAIADARHVSYTPNANFHGTDSLQYTVADDAGAQATATLTLTVASVNDAPVAAHVAATTFDDTTTTVTLSGSDVDGDALSFAIASGPAHGTLGAVAGNHVTYTPAAGFTGSDSFTYTAFDGQAVSAPATVDIAIVRGVCGNGVREGVHEECDDGNTIPGDGCEANCKLTCGSGTGADRATVDTASGHCFVAYDGVHNSYQEAAALCGGFGGHLPTIATAAEDDAAFAAVRAGDTAWLGGDDIAVEGTFRWTTGEAFGFSNFEPGKPDNAGNADCLRYLADGNWSDTACGGAAVSGTLCEFELATTTPAVATGGAGTRGVAIADLNGDGYPDIAAVNQTGNNLGVLLGNGAGGFALQATYATGTGPVAVGAGDFNGDGRVDLAVVNATASTVKVFLGTPSGAFNAGATIAIASSATAIEVADLDQDGKLDLAVAASGAVQVLKGDGNGGFTVQGSISILGLVAGIAAGDFDGDGRIDLALTTPAAVLVVLGTGGGAFGLPISVAVSTNNRMVVAADLDGDGRLDLAVANGAASVSVFLGTATGLFGAATTLTVAAQPQAVAAGDFDGDGVPDLMAVTSGFATLFHGAGGTFTQSVSIATGGGGASFAAAGNVNGDGAKDLVIANTATSTAGVVLGGGGLAAARALLAGSGTASTVSADFNQDGLPDLALIDPAASKAFVFLATPAGALVQSAAITLQTGAGSTYGVAADFDGDGKLDLAIANVTFSSVSVLLGAGNGTFGAPLNTGVAQSPRRLAVGDFNGDGKPDLAVPAETGNALTILANTGGGRFGRVADLAVGTGPSAAVVADFNGDNKKDIAVVTTGEASIKVLLGHGDSTFSAPTSFAIASGSMALAAGDLDGDGKIDLAATNTVTSNVSVLRGSGTGAFGTALNVATGAQPQAITAVDLDGDLRLDLVVGNAASNDVTVLHNDGNGGFVAFGVAVGASPSWVTAVDLDHDGHLDLAASTGNPFVTLMFSAR